MQRRQRPRQTPHKAQEHDEEGTHPKPFSTFDAAASAAYRLIPHSQLQDGKRISDFSSDTARALRTELQREHDTLQDIRRRSTTTDAKRLDTNSIDRQLYEVEQSLRQMDEAIEQQDPTINTQTEDDTAAKTALVPPEVAHELLRRTHIRARSNRNYDRLRQEEELLARVERMPSDPDQIDAADRQLLYEMLADHLDDLKQDINRLEGVEQERSLSTQAKQTLDSTQERAKSTQAVIDRVQGKQQDEPATGKPHSSGR